MSVWHRIMQGNGNALVTALVAISLGLFLVWGCASVLGN